MQETLLLNVEVVLTTCEEIKKVILVIYQYKQVLFSNQFYEALSFGVKLLLTKYCNLYTRCKSILQSKYFDMSFNLFNKSVYNLH